MEKTKMCCQNRLFHLTKFRHWEWHIVSGFSTFPRCGHPRLWGLGESFAYRQPTGITSPGELALPPPRGGQVFAAARTPVDFFIGANWPRWVSPPCCLRSNLRNLFIVAHQRFCQLRRFGQRASSSIQACFVHLCHKCEHLFQVRDFRQGRSLQSSGGTLKGITAVSCR